MLNDNSLVQIDLSPEYKQNLRSLSKRYRNIRSDTQEVLEQIQKRFMPNQIEMILVPMKFSVFWLLSLMMNNW